MKRSLFAIMAALTLQGAAWAQDSRADAAMVEMRDAYSHRDKEKVNNLLPSVRGHVLEPLALYWATKPQLETAAPSTIRNALSRMAGSYWEDRLRNDWLLQLGKNRDWANFEIELPRFRMNDDRQVQCYGLMLDAAARRIPAGEAARQTTELWHQQRDAEDGCSTAAKAFLDSGHMPPEAAWMRARLAVEANKPDAALQAIGLLDPQWAGIAKTIVKDPGDYVDDKITAIRPRTKELVTLAIVRLGAIDLPAAVQNLQRKRWAVQLTDEELGWAWGSLGQRAAKALDPNALSLYANGQDRFMSADHLAWKARAGLRAGQWNAVRDAIAAMSPAQRSEPVWVYWQARSLQALRLPEAPQQVQALYASIASTTGFYEQLAMEELGQAIGVPPMPLPVSTEELRTAESNPGVQRALTSFRLGLRSEAVREWHYTVALHSTVDLTDRELLAIAQLACNNSLWDRCINTSTRTQVALDHKQRFPTPYLPQVTQRAQAIGLDPAYVYGLIRQESRFVVAARSGVGASGLMQVMPATARWTARKIGLTDFQPSQINDRDTNIQIGTAYLKLALDDFEGSMPMAAAAYNAGPGRPRRWREGPTLAGEIWTENIPFDETRDYVKQVLANTTNYAALLTGQPQSLRARLGVVMPSAVKAPPILESE
ncbi:lytic transglycosylase [Hydrogenophaga crassostreae]|uniref:Lytic transglycosylase n=1 Tax=Hydrogenophaga crassostreae TaxID=1763535 RepID=A0A167IQF0_9BURK|nr:lytic transglycosylase domain-containing protein [Hydrogenophaga crassostreae]AOW14745.1 lytic transglycosylase [Hydrogenophaga crassostreae]OAD43353.1 lytic transglycosylase [Hydrogenophaga crassostreae]